MLNEARDVPRTPNVHRESRVQAFVSIFSQKKAEEKLARHGCCARLGGGGASCFVQCRRPMDTEPGSTPKNKDDNEGLSNLAMSTSIWYTGFMPVPKVFSSNPNAIEFWRWAQENEPRHRTLTVGLLPVKGHRPKLRDGSSISFWKRLLDFLVGKGWPQYAMIWTHEGEMILFSTYLLQDVKNEIMTDDTCARDERVVVVVNFCAHAQKSTLWNSPARGAASLTRSGLASATIVFATARSVVITGPD